MKKFDKKSFITVFLVLITLQFLKRVDILDNWILTELFKLVVCLVVLFIFAYIWNVIKKEKF